LRVDPAVRAQRNSSSPIPSFTQQPICTASREYQSLKIAQLENQGLPPEELEKNIAGVMEKVCLCEDLAASAPGTGKNQRAVAVCPGPNLAYFTKNASLEEMVGTYLRPGATPAQTRTVRTCS